MLVADPERRDDLAALLRGASHQVETIPDAAAASDSLRRPRCRHPRSRSGFPGARPHRIAPAPSPRPRPSSRSLWTPPSGGTLPECCGSLTATSGRPRLLLGISRSTLLNKVRKYALLIGWACLLPMVAPPLASQGPSPIPAGRLTSGTLSFDGHATVGDFVGRTTTVSGEITGGAELSAVRGWVQAPVKTLTTDNGRRDKDLNKSMESDKYPDIRFELSGITPRGGNDDSVRVTLLGKLHHSRCYQAGVPAGYAALQQLHGAGSVRLSSQLEGVPYRWAQQDAWRAEDVRRHRGACRPALRPGAPSHAARERYAPVPDGIRSRPGWPFLGSL